MPSDVPPGFHPLALRGRFYDTVAPLYARLMGGRVSIGFRVAERHANGIDVCHGGMLMTVGDIQLGFGANLEAGVGQFLPTINMTSDFVAPARLGQWVEGASRLVRRTRGLAFAEAILTADGDPVMRCNGIMKIPSGPQDFDINAILPPEHVPVAGEAGQR